MKPFLFLCLLAVGAAPAWSAPTDAATGKPIKIDPDGPDFATGSGIVPRGNVQVESGFTTTRRGDSRNTSLGQFLVRVPVSERAEVRLSGPTYLTQRDNGRSSGVNDVSLEARFLLRKTKNAKYGVQLSSVLPTGSRAVAQRRYQPGVILTTTLTLSKRNTLVIDAGTARASSSERRFSRSFLASSFRHDLSDKVRMFVEAYAYNREKPGGRSQKFAATGLIYFPRPNVAFNVHAGTGLGNHIGGPDFYYSSGVAYLF